MREQLPNPRHQSPHERMVRIRKNIQIRKLKLYGPDYPTYQSPLPEPNQNSKEDKGYLQKLKNRQAAQKSREQKKQYLTVLEQQIQTLKHKMSHCPNCRLHLEATSSEVDNTREETNSRQNHDISSFEDNAQENQSPFYRVSSSSEDSSIGIYLFCFMIILGVFCMGARFQGSNSAGPFRRDLMQTFEKTQSKELVPQNSDFIIEHSSQLQRNLNPTYSTLSEIDIDPSKYQNGLLSMDQVKSPASILDDRVFEKIVTAFQNYKLIRYDDKNLRSKSGLVDANKSLMFCSRPKIYRSHENEDGVMMTFLDIFVEGAEIVNILPTSSENSLTGNVQLNGLYKITASVQQIEEIINPNLVY